MVQVPGCGCSTGGTGGGGDCASVVVSHGFCSDTEPSRPLLVRTVVLCNGTLQQSVVEMDGTPYVGPVKECGGDCCDDAATSVVDTNSIDLSLAANTLSADLKIDPSSPSPLTITANGLYVECCEDAATSASDTNSIDLTLAGGNLSADLNLDPASPASLSITSNGLYVECCDETISSVQDTNTVDLTLLGGQLSADVRIDPASTAVVTTSPAGLRIDDSGGEQTTVSDTNSVDLALVGYDIKADVRVDPASPLPITITANGLSVADTSTGQWVTQVKTVDESFTNLVEQDILELLGFAPIANAVYEAQMLLITSSSVATVGVQTRMNFPVGLGGSGHVIESPDNTYSSIHVRWGGPPISSAQGNVPTVNEKFLQRMSGIFDIGPAPGAGHIRPQVKSETGAVVYVHRGSIFKWRRVL